MDLLISLYFLLITELCIFDSQSFCIICKYVNIELPVVITQSLVNNSIILFFVKLVGLFNNLDSFKKSNNASFDTLSKKIASHSFGILPCFINEIA